MAESELTAVTVEFSAWQTMPHIFLSHHKGQAIPSAPPTTSLDLFLQTLQVSVTHIQCALYQTTF